MDTTRSYNKIVIILLKHNVDTKAKDNEGKTALMYAIDNGNNEVVKSLS